jgi:hypothetical protein
MQIFGCYSTKYLTNQELRQNHTYSPIKITTNDGREFIIKNYVTADEIENDSGIIYCSDFYWLDDNLILTKNTVGLSSQKDNYGNQIKLIKTETLSLSKDMISEITVSEYNPTATIILSGIGVLAIIAVLIFVFRPNVVSYSL